MYYEMNLMVKMILREILEMANTENFANLRMTQSSDANRSVDAANSGRSDSEQQQREVGVN